ncbi:MAG TPA: GTP-binding protein, partial [Pyrinomonadaceae bacterium]
MKAYATESIRNLAVIGHGDVGKTQLISSLLYVAGATPRWGKVDEGTTVTDHEDDSIARKITLNTALAHLEHRDTKINFIDTPGYAAFISHARPALRVADCALAVVDGVKGVEVQTEKTWAYANEFMVPRIMAITKLDKEHSDFGKALESAQKTFSRAIIPFTLPIGKEKDFRGVVDVVHMKAYELGADGQAKEIDIPTEGREYVDKTRERLVELVAESDDALMEKYFEQGTLDESDILPNINKAIANSKLCPVFAVSGATLVGLRAFLNAIVDYAPDPAHHEAEYGFPVDAPADAERIAR